FNWFVQELEKEQFEIFLKTLDCLTIRAKFPKGHKHSGVADFVIARKELGYIHGTRKPNILLGTLEDDLLRRDFTVNALAKSEDGAIIDLFNGQKDLRDKILRTPIDVAVSFNDDPLRILRAMRFAITKGMELSDEIWRALDFFDAKKLSVVSLERKREELFKCFKYDTKSTLRYLDNFKLCNYPLFEEILADGIWLEPTLKK